MRTLGYLMLLLTTVVACSASERQPAVAGSFYPANPTELRTTVEKLLEAAGQPATPAVAIVVPHAGYVFSAATAAKGFAALRGSKPQRVILLGPTHHQGYSGGALPAAGITAFATPLGPVAVDTEALARLRKCPGLDGPASAHDPEHSLEVQLPFLRVIAPEAKIVPVLLGPTTDLQTCDGIARCLAPLLDGKTAVIASSDFTHHGAAYDYAPFGRGPMVGPALVRLGRATAGRAAAADVRGFWQQVEVSGDTVCGVRGITVLTDLVAHAFDGHGRVVDVTTSGHVTGSWGDQVVTYASVAFEGSWRAWRDDPPTPPLGTLSTEQGKALVALARATLGSHLRHDEGLADWFAGHQVSGQLLGAAGSFVTINNRGEREKSLGKLRACMGVIAATEPVVDAVMSSAVSAAHDPRFPKLEAEELNKVTLEVSVLSPTHPVPGPEAIVVGTHGVLLHKGGRSAVFLPQVAPEQGWDRDTMLEQLSRKAGLPGDAWKSGATFEVFTAQVFAEGE